VLETEKLSPGLRFLSFRDVQSYFGLKSIEAARELCVDLLDLGTLKYHRVVSPPDTTGKTDRQNKVEFVEEKVLAIALEMALFAHLLPFGRGIDLTADPIKPARPSVMDAVRENAAFSVPEYWQALRKDPHKLQLMVALSALLYGPHEEKELHSRLHALGDFLTNKAVRTYKKKEKEKCKPSSSV
jgi:hypothetical protein